MSYSVSTLMIRNLRDVFGENDPARRRAAIDEIYNEDGAFHDPGGVYSAAMTRSTASQASSGPLTLTFNISPLPRPRSWAITDGLNGYRAALVRCQLTPGLISSLLGTAGLPTLLCFSTNPLSWTLPCDILTKGGEAQKHLEEYPAIHSKQRTLTGFIS